MNSELIIASTVPVVFVVVSWIVWDWFKSGRVRKGEYYMTVVGCRAKRSTCNIHAISDALARQKNTMIREDADIKGRLKAIEDGMKEAKEEAKGLRAEVSGIRSAVDRMAGAIESYAEVRKKREGDESRHKRQL